MQNMAQAQRTYHAAFLSNPAIRTIAGKPKWTISDKDKKPISLYYLLWRHDATHGCQADMPCDMLPLDQMIDRFHAVYPQAGLISNFAFNLDVMEDNLVVLDIEPTCSPSLMAKFLELPYLYGERSMSGKGVHLVFPKPSNFEDFPAAMQKLALKGPKKHYEILLAHWVTFTGNTLKRPVGRNIENQKPFEALYAELAQKQTTSQTIEADIDAGGIPSDVSEIPDSDYILELLTKETNDYRRTPEDFDNDMSRYEHGYTGHKYYKLKLILALSRIQDNGHLYTVEERVRLVYEAVKATIAYREKHERVDHGIPWLMQQAIIIVKKDTPKEDPAFDEFEKRTGVPLRDEE